ncbi:MAG: DUF6362 family protein [Alphaproteobacteria bacterium]
MTDGKERKDAGAADTAASAAPTPDARRRSIEAVKQRMKDAADTLKRLKVSGHVRPRLPFSAWPDVVRNYFEAGLDPEGQPRETRVLPPRPSPKAIDEMDEALAWLLELTREQRVAVFAAAMGIRRSRVARRLGVSRVTVWRLETAGLLRIATKLKE